MSINVQEISVSAGKVFLGFILFLSKIRKIWVRHIAELSVVSTRESGVARVCPGTVLEKRKGGGRACSVCPKKIIGRSKKIEFFRDFGKACEWGRVLVPIASMFRLCRCLVCSRISPAVFVIGGTFLTQHVLKRELPLALVCMSGF